MRAIDKAIQRLSPPTQAEMARRLSAAASRQITPQQVNSWVKRGWAAPKYAPVIERMTGVTCLELVADIGNNKHDS